MRFLLNCGILYGQVYAPSPKIECVAIWYQFRDLDWEIRGFIKAGVLNTIFQLDFKSFIRLKKLGDAKSQNRKSLLEKPYYFLDIIGTAPAFKRQGHARTIIKDMLAMIDSENMGCYLVTSNRDNISS